MQIGDSLVEDDLSGRRLIAAASVLERRSEVLVERAKAALARGQATVKRGHQNPDQPYES